MRTGSKKRISTIEPSKMFDGAYYVTVDEAMRVYAWASVSYLEFLCAQHEVLWVIQEGMIYFRASDLRILDNEYHAWQKLPMETMYEEWKQDGRGRV